VGFAGGGGAYKDDRLPHYNFAVKQYLVKVKAKREDGGIPVGGAKEVEGGALSDDI